MGQFDVHIFPIVRVRVPGVTADTHKEATTKADEQVDFYKLFGRETPFEVEFAEEVSHYLVDTRREGAEFDSEIDPSYWLACDGETEWRQGYPEVTIKLINGQLWKAYVPQGVPVHVHNLRDRDEACTVGNTVNLDCGVHDFNDGELLAVDGPQPEHVIISQDDAREMKNMLSNMCEFLMENHQEEIDNDHDGDDSCSYCEAVQKAKALIAKYEIAEVV